MISEFIKQDEELEAFITGPAGSGKTTDLLNQILVLNELKINYQVVAYTHKAKDVLISKLPAGTPISTLHSWLKKRPGINEEAKHLRTLLTSKQYGKPEPLELLIVDEFSFVGESDYFAIGKLQDINILEDNATIYGWECIACDTNMGQEVEDLENDGDVRGYCTSCKCIRVLTEEPLEVGDIAKPLKVLYVGDLNQLSPIEGVSAVVPIEPFWTKLTHIYRQDSLGLQEPLDKLVKIIEGEEQMSYLQATDDFIRAVDIDAKYAAIDSESKIMLAYTNKAVQLHNSTIQGYEFPKAGDTVYNHSTKEVLEWVDTIALTDTIELHTPSGKITKDTKYNPFRELRKNKDIIYVQDARGLITPCLFGVYNNKIKRQEIGLNLTNANKANKSGTIKKNAYKAFKVLNDYVSIIDFNHCQTVHKSQGQEFDYVFVDSINLSTCRDKSEMCRLLYVALSRAKTKLFLNN